MNPEQSPTDRSAIPTPEFAGVNWRAAVAGLAAAAIATHLVLRHFDGFAYPDAPLFVALAVGGLPLTVGLLWKALHGEFGSDLLAGLSIITSVVLGEYLAGAIVVLMLSGGETLEAYATRRASSALSALSRRLPLIAHRLTEGRIEDVAIGVVCPGDSLVVLPHEVCPVDGTVTQNRGSMDESFLTGEPYQVDKAPGTPVLSGAVNGPAALTVRAERVAADTRYAQIMRVMRDTEQRRPRMRRIGDRLGAYYTPVAVTVAVAAGLVSGDATRALAVLVVATPCPLLIAIPVAIIGAVSLSARRGIIIKDPAVLERVDRCRTAVFDKTGTLTYGQPTLTDVVPLEAVDSDEVLALVASLERYSKHPLARAVLAAARTRNIPLREADEVREPPGAGLSGRIGGVTVAVTGRLKFERQPTSAGHHLPPSTGGLECIVLVEGRAAAILRFRDKPRTDGAPFIRHLGPRHGFDRILIVSGDRESEVRYLAEQVGVAEVHASQSPEQKLKLVRTEVARAPTAMFGDGVNDAPALAAATVGVAMGVGCDVTSEAAGAVIMDSSLAKVDELLHIGRRLRAVVLQSTVGGMAFSLIAMAVAAAGYLSPVSGAVLQEVIDLAAVVNALRASVPPRALTDYHAD